MLTALIAASASPSRRRPSERPRRPRSTSDVWHNSLILRDLPLKERFTVVDTASIPTPTPLRNPIRARAEKCLLTVRARELSATCRWVLTEKSLEL